MIYDHCLDSMPCRNESDCAAAGVDAAVALVNDHHLVLLQLVEAHQAVREVAGVVRGDDQLLVLCTLILLGVEEDKTELTRSLDQGSPVTILLACSTHTAITVAGVCIMLSSSSEMSSICTQSRCQVLTIRKTDQPPSLI